MLLRHESFHRLCRARDLLQDVDVVRHDDDDAPMSIEDIARAVGISPFHFIRQFEAVFGLTPHQFRIEARLDRARHLLAEGAAVTDVCMDVGFSSLGSFSTLFARRFGVPPSEYGRRHRAHRRGDADGAAPGCLSLMASLPVAVFKKQ